MTDLKTPPDPRRRRRSLIRVGVIVASVGAGILCGYLPEQYQALCRMAAKIAALFGGG